MTQASSLAAPMPDRVATTWDLADARAHLPACLQVARLLLHDEHLAEDAVQEAFLDAWQHRDRFDPSRSTQRAWLLMLTHRRAVDRVRYEQRHRDERAVRNEQQLRDESARTAAEDPWTAVSLAERRAAVRTALRELPAVQREALVLLHWGGYTQREIAALMDCPLGTVKTRCHSGMRRMKATLRGLPPSAT